MEHEFDTAALLSPPDIFKCKKILCVQPHPDDNEIGMGGIIAALTKKGCEAHYLTVTNGDKGCLDRDIATEQAAVILREEAEASGRLLGATSFYFLGHSDALINDVLGLSKEIAGVIRKVRPDAVFCPDPWLVYEGHFDHVITGRAVSHAFQLCANPHFPVDGDAEPWPVSAIGYYYTSNPNTIVDITNVYDLKMDSIAVHKHQIDEQTLALYRIYFKMKGEELAAGKGFAIGEGVKLLSRLHTHCFVDAYKI